VRYVFPRGGIGGTAAREASVWPERPAATEAPAWTEAPVAGESARGGEAGTETRGETVAWSQGIRQEDDSEREPPLH
ncbi:MAG TPA: hypothetical protein VER55_05620, partial [Ardenticatenaceae bacterium]|nr:hypothetical protein [Ardenticatenaceae bacterium]